MWFIAAVKAVKEFWLSVAFAELKYD